MDKLDILSECRTRYNSLKNEKEAFTIRQTKLDVEINKIILDRDHEKMRLEQAESDLRGQKDALEAKKEEINSSIINMQSFQKDLDTLRKEQNRCLSELQTARSRSKVLKDMESSLEGYNYSVKAILKACREKEGFGEGIFGALAQLITVREHFETAIEVSLGQALQNIVTEDEYTAKNAINYLKENRLGRATFLPITSVKPRVLDSDIVTRLEREKGYLGLASDMVYCEPKFKDIILSILGRTVVVDNIDNGIAISRKFKFSFRVVTVEGEVLNPGLYDRWKSAVKILNLLSRNRIIKELDDKISVLTDKYQKLEKSCSEKADAIKNRRKYKGPSKRTP